MITIEQLKEFAATDDGKKVIEAYSGEYAKAQGWKSPEEIQGLVDKRDELLRKNAELKKRPVIEESDKILLDFLKEKSILDTDDLEKVFSGQAKGGEITEEFQRVHKKALKDLELLRSDILNKESLFKNERELRIKTQRDNTITSLLNEVKVQPELLPAAISFMEKRLKFDISDDGKISFMADDDITPASQFVKEWANSDMGKKMVMPLENTGAGSHLRNGKGISEISDEDFKKKSPTEQAALAQKQLKGELKIT